MKPESEVLSQFRAALESRAIIPPQPIIADGHLHRCDAQGKHGKDDAAYVLHLDGLPAGGFENHRDGIGWQNWRAEADRTLNRDEQRAHQKRVKDMQATQQADQQARQDQARQRAADIWDAASPAPADHPYLIKKQVRPHHLRAYKDALVVPVRDLRGQIHTLQFIAADGFKRFLKDGKKQECWSWIGNPSSADTICIAEGFATGATIHEATGYPTAVAFDAGNLLPVAKALAQAYPKARIVLCADDDATKPDNPGLTQARAAAKAVRGVVAVPDFGKHRPDWATDFNDLYRLLGSMTVTVQIDTAMEPDADRIEIIQLDEVQAEPVRWLWPGRFALGKLSLIAGHPGLGKSQLTAALAAVITTGGTWPVTGEPFGPPGDVLFLSAEDDPADTIKPRLQAAGADLRRCRILGCIQSAPDEKRRTKRRYFNFLEDLKHLDRTLTRYPAKLVIVDPLSAYMGDSRKIDTHKTSDVRSVLAPLVELAGNHRTAVIGVFHLNKREGSSAMDRVNGSVGFVATARACWLVAKDKDNKAHRVFVQMKNNLAPDQDGLKFEICSVEVDSPHGPIPTSHLLWHSEAITMDADDALSGGGGANDRHSVLDDAQDFLREQLANGPRLAAEIFASAEAEGYSEKTVYRAKDMLRVVSRKDSKHWIWSLPTSKEDGQDSQDGQDNLL